MCTLEGQEILGAATSGAQLPLLQLPIGEYPVRVLLRLLSLVCFECTVRPHIGCCEDGIIPSLDPFSTSRPAQGWLNGPSPVILPILDFFLSEVARQGPFGFSGSPRPASSASSFEALEPHWACEVSCAFTDFCCNFGLHPTFCSLPPDWGPTGISVALGYRPVIRRLFPSVFSPRGKSPFSNREDPCSNPSFAHVPAHLLGFDAARNFLPYGVPGSYGIKIVSGRSLEPVFQAVHLGWGLTSTSVALGCCPTGLLSLLFSLFSFVGVFYTHFSVILGCALIRLLLYPLKAQKRLFGRLLLLPAAGIPHSVLRPLDCLRVQTRQLDRLGNPVPKHPKRSAKGNASRRIHRMPSKSFLGMIYGLFCMTLPVQVFSAPKPWGEAVEIILATARLFPEALPAPATEAFNSELPVDNTAGQASIEGFSNTIQHAPEQCPEPPLQNSLDILVPPLDERLVSAQPDRTVQCWCYVLAPHHQSETLSFALRFPASVEAFCTSARDALRELRLRYLPLVVPTFPQLALDFASLVVVPLWLHASNKQIIVFDFSAIGGPIYASFTWERVTYGDCASEASRHALRNWSVCVQGHTQALLPNESFLAVEGGVIQFQPEGAQAVWRGTLQARLDRPNAWSQEPEIPDYGTEWPLYITHHDRRTIYSQRRFPGEPTVACIANLVQRSPDRVLLVTPPGRVLENIEYFGTACRDAIAVYPLTPSPDRECIVVFLDPRQADRHVTHILLAEAAIDPLALVQFLDLHPPPGYKIEVWPRVREDGRLFLAEGDVVVFGYVPNVPPDDSDDDDSVLASGSSSGGSPPPPGPPRGPPPAVPYTQLPASLLARAASSSDTGQTNTGRSRSPPSRGNNATVSALEAQLVCYARKDTIGQALCKDPCSNILQGPLHKGFTFVGSKCEHLQPIEVILHDTFAGTSALSACEQLFELSKACFSCEAHCIPSFQCKLLNEPECHNSQDRQALRHLRRVTIELGGSWPYNVGEPSPFLWDEHSEGSSIRGSDEELVRWVSVIVLKPFYRAEDLTIVLQFPATEVELCSTVQDARQYATKFAFPHLKLVQPQPSDETIVLIALPGSQGLASVACIDSTRLDGRLFAVELPLYVDRRTVLDYADLPSDAHVLVYIGHAFQPLPDGVHVHLFPAITVTIIDADSLPPPFHDATQLLLQGLTWSAVSVFATWATDGVYCLVTHYSSELFRVDQSRPWQYRQRLADVVGSQAQDLRIFSAAPAVTDASIGGYPCRTVLIGVLGFRDEAFCFLLDCRPLLQGWRCLRSSGSLFPTRLIVEEVADGIPLGWCVVVYGESSEPGYVSVGPGTVVQLGLAPRADDRPFLFVHFSSADPPETFHAETADTGNNHPPHEDSYGWGAQRGSPEETNRHDPIAPEIQVPEPVAAAAVDSDTFEAVFLVLVPGFMRETIVLTLTAPASMPHVLVSVNAQRSDTARRRFPHLIETFPQPDTSFGTFVAVPDWDCLVATVLVDARGAGGTFFATTFPARADRSLVLTLCGYDATADVLVYIRDTPWQLVDNYPVRVSNGDLLLVTRPDHAVIVSAFLSDMLLSPVGWIAVELIPSPRPNAAWFVTTPQQFSFQLPSNPLRQYEREVAIHTQCHVDEVHVFSAIPDIVDHSSFGIGYEHNFAVARPGSGQRADTSTVTCILDLRPILCGLEQLAFSSHELDVARVIDRYLPSAPFGFGVGLFGGQEASNHRRYIDNGTVLTVEFLTDEQSQSLRHSLAGYTPPSGRWPTQIGASGVGSPIDSSPSSTRVAQKRRHTPGKITLGQASPTLLGLGSIAPPQCHCAATRSPTWGARPAKSVFGFLRRWLTLGLLAAQLQPSTASHLSFHQAFLMSCWLWQTCPPCDAMITEQTYSALQQKYSPGCFGLTTAGDDKCALVPKDEACPSRPQGDTPVPPTYARLWPQGSRRLPTPCRANRPTPIIIGPTLLEEAVAASDCPAYFLAATLLDTLEEHFHCQDAPSSNPSLDPSGQTVEDIPVKATRTQPHRIDLVQAIPPTVYQSSHSCRGTRYDSVC